MCQNSPLKPAALWCGDGRTRYYSHRVCLPGGNVQSPALVMLTCACTASICLVHDSSPASHFTFYQLFLTFLGHGLTPLGIQQKAWSISQDKVPINTYTQNWACQFFFIAVEYAAYKAISSVSQNWKESFPDCRMRNTTVYARSNLSVKKKSQCRAVFVCNWFLIFI